MILDMHSMSVVSDIVSWHVFNTMADLQNILLDPCTVNQKYHLRWQHVILAFYAFFSIVVGVVSLSIAFLPISTVHDANSTQYSITRSKMTLHFRNSSASCCLWRVENRVRVCSTPTSIPTSRLLGIHIRLRPFHELQIFLKLCFLLRSQRWSAVLSLLRHFITKLSSAL